MQSAVMTMSRRGHPKEKVLMLRSQRRLAGGNCAESAGSPESRRSLHLNLVRGVGEANRNIEIVAILSCTLGLRLLMLCPESSSKRPALTRETMLSHGTPAAIPLFRSYSRSGRPRWSPPCRPAAVESWVLVAGRFRFPQTDSDGCRWLLRPGACLRAPRSPVAAACFCGIAQNMTMTLAPVLCQTTTARTARCGSSTDWNFHNWFSLQRPRGPSVQPLTHDVPQSPSRGPGPGDDTPVPVRRPISSRLCTRGLAECQNTILRRLCHSRPPAPTPWSGQDIVASQPSPRCADAQDAGRL